MLPAQIPSRQSGSLQSVPVTERHPIQLDHDPIVHGRNRLTPIRINGQWHKRCVTNLLVVSNGNRQTTLSCCSPPQCQMLRRYPMPARHLADHGPRLKTLADDPCLNVIRPAAASTRTLDHLNTASEAVHLILERSTL